MDLTEKDFPNADEGLQKEDSVSGDKTLNILSPHPVINHKFLNDEIKKSPIDPLT